MQSQKKRRASGNAAPSPSPGARGRRPAARRRSTRWIGVAALLVVVVAGLAFAVGGGGQPAGRLNVATTNHDFGSVPINGGLIFTQFPLDVSGPVTITDISTS